MTPHQLKDLTDRIDQLQRQLDQARSSLNGHSVASDSIITAVRPCSARKNGSWETADVQMTIDIKHLFLHGGWKAVRNATGEAVSCLNSIRYKVVSPRVQTEDNVEKRAS